MNAPTAWFTSDTRSVRNNARFTQPARCSRSTSAIAVRVLPLPVAITSSALRRLCRELLADAANGSLLVVPLDDVDPSPATTSSGELVGLGEWIRDASSSFL